MKTSFYGTDTVNAVNQAIAVMFNPSGVVYNENIYCELPTDIVTPFDQKISYEDLEKQLGFSFKYDSDCKMIMVLPHGWTKRRTEHPLWTDLLDNKGRQRAAIYCKFANYSSIMHILPFFNIDYQIHDINNQLEFRDDGSLNPEFTVDSTRLFSMRLKNGNSEIIETRGPYLYPDAENIIEANRKLKIAMRERFVDSDNVFKYW